LLSNQSTNTGPLSERFSGVGSASVLAISSTRSRSSGSSLMTQIAFFHPCVLSFCKSPSSAYPAKVRLHAFMKN
jgi:hypothetical protein